MAGQPSKALKIFYCYAHEDKELRRRLDTHMAPLRRSGKIIDWCDQEIQAGLEWKHEIDLRLNDADIILLLVSADFIASDYCSTEEMQRALERHRAGKARVIPIILKPAHWQTTPLGKLQALPSDGRPVSQWRDKEEAFFDIIQGIKKVVESLSPKPPTSYHIPKRAEIYIEREELERVLQVLEPQRRTYLVTIGGAGGMGKTTLAIELAHRCQQEGWFEQIIWTTAQPRRFSSSARNSPPFVEYGGLLDEVLGAFGFPELTDNPLNRKQKLAYEYLDDLTTLLVVDNLDAVRNLSPFYWLFRATTSKDKSSHNLARQISRNRAEMDRTTSNEP